MKANKSAITLNGNFIALILLSVLALSMTLMLSGCSNTAESAKEAATPTQEATSQAAAAAQAPVSTAEQPVDQTAVSDPTLLTEIDLTLSLEGYGAKGALADQDLTIYDMLMYAAQDEYLAHGEYVAIVEQFGSQNPYTNIIGKEEVHLAYLKEVYLAYDLDFPADASADHIVMQADLLEAAQPGVQAEIDNIAMYELFLTKDLPQNVFDVFTSLKNGSVSHLAAFEKQVVKL